MAKEMPSHTPERQFAEKRLRELATAWQKLQNAICDTDISEKNINDVVRNAPPQTELAFQELLQSQYNCLSSLYSNEGGVNANPETLQTLDYMLAEAVYGKSGNAAEKHAASSRLSAMQSEVRDYWNIVAKTEESFDLLAPEHTTGTKGQVSLQMRAEQFESKKLPLIKFINFAKNYQQS